MPGMTNSSDHASTLSVMSRLSTKALPKMSKPENRSSNRASSPSTSFRQKRLWPMETLPPMTNCASEMIPETGRNTRSAWRRVSG